MGSNPTLSAITALAPSIGIIFRPTRTWRAVHAARPGWATSIFVQVLPFAALCALPWPFLSTVLLAMVAVLILALGIFLISPMFDVRRNWNGSMAVAAYASTPVLLAWSLLVVPALAVLPVIALLHSFALAYLGVQEVLGCRENEAALFVAVGWVFSAFGSMLVGALCGAAGFL